MDRRQFLAKGTAGLFAASVPQVSLAQESDPLACGQTFRCTGPLSNAARRAAPEFIDDRTSRSAYDRGQARVASARARFAKRFQVTPEEVAFLYPTSEGENIVTRARLQAGRQVVVDELHFTTSFVLYRQLEHELGSR